MPRRAAVVAIAAAVVVCIAVLGAAVWRQVDAGPPIQTEALGVWQERTEADPVRVTISSSGDDSGSTQFWVTYPRTSEKPFPAMLEGDTITVLGEDVKDVVWAITYDEGADALLVARPSTGERHILRRVSR